MAIGDPYADADDYRDYWRVTDSDAAPNRDVDIERALIACSRLIDKKTQRHFSVDTADQTRVFIADPLAPDLTWLEIDDLSATPTSVTIDEDNDGSFADDTALASDNFELWPINAALGPEARPFTSLKLTRWGDKQRLTSSFPNRVQIVGLWGWPAVPEAVKQACIELAGIVRLQSPRATQEVQSVDAVVQTSPDGQRIIRDLVAAYRRERF